MQFNPYRVYLGEYKLYQNSEPLPRQKFYVRLGYFQFSLANQGL